MWLNSNYYLLSYQNANSFPNKESYNRQIPLSSSAKVQPKGKEDECHATKPHLDSRQHLMNIHPLHKNLFWLQTTRSYNIQQCATIT